MITVRPARLEDAEALKTFAGAIHEERLPHFRQNAGGMISLEAIRRAVREADTGADRCGLVAEEAGQIIGTLECRPLEHPVTTITHEVAISVARDRRQKGVGGQLLDRALAWACDDARVDGVSGEIVATNMASIRLVESRSFWKSDLRLWPGGPRQTEATRRG
jgi:GNAT superfamily N-acetyltransferase